LKKELEFLKEHASLFFLCLLFFCVANANDSKIISDWKKIKHMALSDRVSACENLKTAKWTEKFKHQDLIEFKKREYCKTPPMVIEKNVASLLAAAVYYREEFDHEEAKKRLNQGLELAKSASEKIDLLSEQLRIDQILQDKKARIQTLKRLSLLDPEKYTVDYARILWTYSKTKSALKVLKSAEHNWPQQRSKQSVFYILGRIYEEQKKLKLAQSYFDKALRQQALDSDIFKNLLSTMAWQQFKKNQFSKSIELWEKLDQFAPDRFTKMRAQFWMAKSYQKLKKPEQALEIYNQIIQEDPLSYFSALSHLELDKKFAPFQFDSNIKVTELKKHSEISTDLADKWKWALAFEENVFLESMIQPLISSFYNQSEKDQSILIENLWSANLTNLLTQLLSQAPLSQRTMAYQKYTPYLFPMPFRNQITSEANAHKIEPSLVYSLIRQESGFNPAARSSTDALGLMQVMPKVARKIAKTHQIELSDSAELFQPDLNIKIGTLELKERLAEFKNNYVLAIASYNAGTDPVHGWVKSRKRKEVIEFIEEIPFEETRNYVRLILRNQIIYKRLTATEEFSFPSDWLKKIN
jgi:soluble lytic murein transglycosylase